MSDHTSSIAFLTDKELVAEVTRLAAVERGAIAALVAHLAELDSRRLYLDAGFSSLFAYCTARLGLSEHETYNRIEAARAARRFPVILDLFQRGQINLTAVRLLAPHLTAENHEDLLESAAGKSRLQVEELLVRISPKPNVRSTVRKLAALGDIPADSRAGDGASPGRDLPASSGGAGPEGPPTEGGPTLPVAARDDTRAAATLAAVRSLSAAVVPLAADRYKVSFTASADTWRKLRQAKELLRHRVPDGDLGLLFDQALTVLLEQLTKRKFAAVTRASRRGMHAPLETPPRPIARESTPPQSPPALVGAQPDADFPFPGRHIPAEVRRAVWKRDEGCCAFVSRDGRRCGERGRLEFHHLQPYAADGPPSVSNIALRCQAHNAHEARLYFSDIRSYVPNGRPTAHAP